MHDLDFDKVPASHGTGKPGDPHRLLGVSGTGCIRQECHALGNEVQNILFFLRVGPAQGQSDDLRAALLDSRFDQPKIIFSRAQDKTALKFVSAQNQFIRHFLPPFRLR
jgi:hypothetical protein